MYGLVLEGGGARGSYHVGVYKAIKEMGIEISGVTGTSIGAINGAMIVQDDYEMLHELWNDISYSMLFNTDKEEINKIKELSLTMTDLNFLRGKIKSFIEDRGLDITPAKETLDKYIYEEKIRNSGKDFGIVTVNMSELRPLEMHIEDIPKGQLKKYLLASSYLPYFKLERIDGNIYLDGGFYDNLPYKMLLSKGYKNLILVRTHAPGLIRKIDLRDIDANITIISPSEDIGKTYRYEAEVARKNIELGYYDGLRAFKKLKGNKYYIQPGKNKDFAFEYLRNISEEDIKKIEKILGSPKLYYRRSLFEEIIPRISNMMLLEGDYTYEDFLIKLIEIKAKKLNLERFNLYGLEEIISILEEEKVKIEENMEEKTVLDKLMEKVDNIYQFHKEEILLRISNIIFKKRT